MNTVLRRTSLLCSLIGSLLVLALPAHAACPDDKAVAAFVADYAVRRASPGFGKDLSMSDAACARGKLVRALPQVMGGVVGYKAAFTSPAVQQRFGVAGPEWGAMFGKMMLASGAKVPAKFGAFPNYEADFVAVVKDARLAEAKTPLEALQSLSHVAPFIELPDTAIEGPPSGISVVSANAAFRGGVLGERIAVEPTQAFLDSLAAMTVVMTEDKSGKELGRSKGSALMGNPIVAAMWLAQALQKEGIALKPGDLLSLGGFLPPAPVQPGTSVTVKYPGLANDPSVTVHFE